MAGRSTARVGAQKGRTRAAQSDRAQKVLALFNEGKTFREIGEILGISRQTACLDFNRALDKLGQTGLAQYVGKLGRPETDPDETVQQYAYELAVSGKSYDAVSKTLGINRGTAWKLIEREMNRRTLPLVSHARLIELDRLDVALDRVMTIMAGNDSETTLKAVDRLVRLSQRRSELLGLDMPAKLEITEVTETDLEIRDMVNSARAKMAAEEQRVKDATAAAAGEPKAT